MRWKRQSRATLDNVVEVLEGLGVMLVAISAQLDRIIRLGRGEDMKKPTPEEIEEGLRQSAAARQKMQEILDRVEARRLEREARRERSLLRRLLPW